VVDGICLCSEPTFDENIFVSDLWDLCLLVELQGIKTALAFYRPGLGG